MADPLRYCYLLFLELFQGFYHWLGEGDAGKAEIFGDGEDLVGAEADAHGVPDVVHPQNPIDLHRYQHK